MYVYIICMYVCMYVFMYVCGVHSCVWVGGDVCMSVVVGTYVCVLAARAWICTVTS